MILGAETITRTSYAAGSWSSAGRWVSGAGTAATISGSVQPAGPKELGILAEGDRSRDPRSVWTFAELSEGSQHAGTSPDRLSIGGVVYEVRSAEVYRVGAPIPHCKAVCVRLAEADSTTRTDAGEAILQGVRAALKAAASLTDAQVIVYGEDAIRPPLPYLAVRVAADRPVGDPWAIEALSAGHPTEAAKGNREAAVTVLGFGRGSAVWLETFAIRLGFGAVADAIAAAGFALTPEGPTVETPTVVDSGHEARFSRDFVAQYAIASTAETGTEATSFPLTMTYP
jgi:hypothetical protein